MMLNNLRRVIYQNWARLKFNWLIEKLLFIHFIGLKTTKGQLNSLLAQILAGRKLNESSLYPSMMCGSTNYELKISSGSLNFKTFEWDYIEEFFEWNQTKSNKYLQLRTVQLSSVIQYE